MLILRPKDYITFILALLKAYKRSIKDLLQLFPGTTSYKPLKSYSGTHKEMMMSSYGVNKILLNILQKYMSLIIR
jgi:hypothetical protein